MRDCFTLTLFEVEISTGSVAQKEKPSLPMISQVEEGGESVSKLV
jgi:hypothetical protein